MEGMHNKNNLGKNEGKVNHSGSAPLSPLTNKRKTVAGILNVLHNSSLIHCNNISLQTRIITCGGYSAQVSIKIPRKSRGRGTG